MAIVCIYCFQKIETTQYLILGGINLEKEEEVELQTFLGAGNYIYASEKNMYVAKNNIEYNQDFEFTSSNTQILRFALNNGKIEFQAETKIEGIESLTQTNSESRGPANTCSGTTGARSTKACSVNATALFSSDSVIMISSVSNISDKGICREQDIIVSTQRIHDTTVI